MPSFFYDDAREALEAGTLDLLAVPLRCMLVTDAHQHEPHLATADDVLDEVRGVGYAAGGRALAGCDFADGRFTADDCVWPAASFAASGAVLYGWGEEADRLLAFFDFGTTVNPAGGPFRLAWDGRTVFTFS